MILEIWSTSLKVIGLPERSAAYPPRCALLLAPALRAPFCPPQKTRANHALSNCRRLPAKRALQQRAVRYCRSEDKEETEGQGHERRQARPARFELEPHCSAQHDEPLRSAFPQANPLAQAH